MFQMDELRRLCPLLFFFLSYTLFFFLWVKTFFYTLPFLLGFLLAAAVQPAVSFLEKKLSWSRAAAAAAITAAALTVLFGLLALTGFFAVREITSLLLRFSDGGAAEFSQPVNAFLEEVGRLFQKLDLDFLERNRQELLDLLQGSMNVILSFLGAVLGVITSLPTVLSMLLVVVFSSFFLARDFPALKAWGRRVLSRGAVLHMKSAAKSSGDAGRRSLFSYLLLYFITFCEAFVVFCILGLPYPLTTALLTSAADVLPVLGPGLVFFPLTVCQLLLGRYARAAGLLIGWAVITCIRQIIEPKLVASSAKVHPLTTLAAVYFSLVGKSLWILLYVIGFFFLHSVFRQTGALPELFPAEAKEKSRESG